MPVATFNKDYFYRLLGFRIDDKRLEDQVAKLGFEIESVGKNELDLEVTPNRPDLLDVVGFARALKNFMHKSKRLTYVVGSAAELEITVGDRVGEIRPYISGLVARNVDFGEESLKSLINFSEKFCATYGRGRRKIAMGMHNLDVLKPPLEYDAYEDEAYDPLGEGRSMRYSEVVGSNPKGQEYKHVIENDKGLYPALKDQDGVMSLIPILNSERTKIDKSTKNVFIDITGMSRYAVEKAADLFAATLIDMGADIRKVEVRHGRRTDAYPKMERRYIKMPLGLAESEIGVKIGYHNVISLANKMGYEAALVGNDIRFKVPEYRLDVINEQDVIEDIAIAYGYDYIQRTRLQAAQQGELEQVTTANQKLSEIMIGLGYSEMMNSFLTNEEVELKSMRIEPQNYCVRLKNPKTESVTIMRTWLLPSLLRNIMLSQHERMPQNIFELDMVFSLGRGKPIESYHVAAVSVDPKSNFNDIKSVLQGFLESADLKYSVGRGEHNSFVPGRCGDIIMEGKKVGFFGELHPDVLHNFGIEEPATAFEIDLDTVYKKISS